MTIVVPDVKPENLKLDLQSSSLEFTGYSESKKATYHVKMDLFAEIDPKESKINHSSRWVELVLRKKELKEEYWPRLLKDKQKVHYLKTNFDKVRASLPDSCLSTHTDFFTSGSTRMSRTPFPRTTTTWPAWVAWVVPAAWAAVWRVWAAWAVTVALAA